VKRPPIRPSPYVSTRAVAELLGVSRRTAGLLLAEGAIPCVRVGIARRALRADVMAYRDRVTTPARRVRQTVAGIELPE
jgi:excisionase family DNA binding protein